MTTALSPPATSVPEPKLFRRLIITALFLANLCVLMPFGTAILQYLAYNSDDIVQYIFMQRFYLAATNVVLFWFLSKQKIAQSSNLSTKQLVSYIVFGVVTYNLLMWYVADWLSIIDSKFDLMMRSDYYYYGPFFTLIFTAIITPIFYQLLFVALFCGYLFRFNLIAIILCAFFFSYMIHITPYLRVFLYLAVGQLVLNLVYYRTRSLLLILSIAVSHGLVTFAKAYQYYNLY